MENENKQCKFCNAEIPATAKKCKFCGEWLSDYPDEIQKFNWGAFLLNWIWCLMNKQYKYTVFYFLVHLIPILGPLAMAICFGIKGNEWAWKAKTWDSVEQFNEAQKFWVRLWFVLTILGIIITFNVIAIIVYISNIQI